MISVSKLLSVSIVCLYAIGVWAQPNIIQGKVSDAQQKAIKGAVVTVTQGSGDNLQSRQNTTDENGIYEIDMSREYRTDFETIEEFEEYVNSVDGGRAGNLVITVSADGYYDSRSTIRSGTEPSGTITRNITLRAITFDTITVTGTIKNQKDSSAINGASVTISYTTGNSGWSILGNQNIDKAISSTDGSINHMIIVEGSVNRMTISWNIESVGFSSKSGRIQVRQNKADIGTIALNAISTEDTLFYRFTGSVTTLRGSRIRNAKVIIQVTSDGTILHNDTTTASNRGGYSSQLTRVYKAGILNVSVLVQADGYNDFTQTLEIPSSTTNITTNVKMTPFGIGIKFRQNLSKLSPDQVRVINVFDLRGKLIKQYSAENISISDFSRLLRSQTLQPLMIRWTTKSGNVQFEKVIPLQ